MYNFYTHLLKIPDVSELENISTLKTDHASGRYPDDFMV